MRKKLYFILIFLVIAITVAVLHARKKEEPVAEATILTLCFNRSVPGTTEAPYAVEENIKLVIDGEKVEGEKSGMQSGPDMTNGYFGTLKGTYVGGKLELLYDYTVEGSEQAEKEIYVFRDNDLIKRRYPLIERKDMLVPDETNVYEEQVYESAYCTES
jgi:hypothetical protein